MPKTPPSTVRSRIQSIVKHYESRQSLYERAGSSLMQVLAGDAELKKLIHSTKHRHKDPGHLQDKLYRKAKDSTKQNKPFDYTPVNYEKKLKDLAGCRIIHLHTSQMPEIHDRLLKVLEVYSYKKIGRPESFSWDIENRDLFKELGMKVTQPHTFYTSTHYVIQEAGTKCKIELQVRSLAEELWGEVSHVINYPHEIQSTACKEQLLALARFTSGCTRLVDSLFESKQEFEDWCTE